ncbi:MAG: hypothetical protein AAFS00_20385, partial [Bacteroidota bacterium]
FCRGTAAARKCQEKMHKYGRAVHRQPGSLRLLAEFVYLVWETFGAYVALVAMLHASPRVFNKV